MLQNCDRKMSLAAGILLFATSAVLCAPECDYDELNVCIREVVLQTGDFDIVSEEHMQEVCSSKRQAIQCASHFIRNCMKKGLREMYETTIGGKLKVVEDMCTYGTRINKGYLEHIDCFGKLQDEISFCNEKFKESQEALSKSDMLERLKVFYGCCAFEWHSNCMAKAARTKCDNKAADFIYYVSTVLRGDFKNQLCASSYSSCHGLHGYEETESDVDKTAIATDSATSNVCRHFLYRTILLTLIWLMM